MRSGERPVSEAEDYQGGDLQAASLPGLPTPVHLGPVLDGRVSVGGSPECVGLTAEEFFRAQAEREGIGYYEWCTRNGILHEDRDGRIRNKEMTGMNPGGDS